MTGSGFVVIGADRLQAALRRGVDSLEDLTTTHSKAAATVAQQARPRTPRRTGALASTVRPGTSTKTTAVTQAGSAAVRYAKPVHFGVPSHNQAAQPWLQDAAEDSQPQWVRHYQTECDRIVADCARST